MFLLIGQMGVSLDGTDECVFEWNRDTWEKCVFKWDRQLFPT